MRQSIKFILLLIIILSFFKLEAKKEWVLVRPQIKQDEFIETISCIDSMNCYLFAVNLDTTEIHRSTDQGKSWHFVNRRVLKYDNGLLNILRVRIFNDSNVYLSYSEKIALEVSENGGKDYRYVTFGSLSDYTGSTFDNIDIFTDSISAGLTFGGKIIHTVDNWQSYEIVQVPDSIFTFRPVHFIDSNNIVFARRNNHNAELIRFNKLERTFNIFSRGSKLTGDENMDEFSDFVFINDSLGYACGGRFTGKNGQSKSIIWKTTDGGKNWIKLVDAFFEPPFGLKSISFRTEYHGIAIGSWGKILETSDGGENWFQHDVRPDMKQQFTLFEWAGSFPLFYSPGGGIFRLETITDVEELSSDEKFRVYQSGRNLEIAINDPTQKQYSFELYSQTGQRLLTRSVSSSYGFIFQPVELIELSNGGYFYTLSSSAGVEFSGKLVVAE